MIDLSKLSAELKKDPKKMMILAGLLAAFALFFYFNILLRPQVAGLFSTAAKVNKLKADLKNANADIARIGEMKASIASYAEKMGRYGDILPTEEGIPALLESLADMARASNMKIISIVPAEEKGGKALKGQAYQAIPITINAKAGYHELGRFMGTLENSGRFMKFADIRVRSIAASPKKHDVELLVLTYVMLEGK
jgi:Tfp pilus assembly protein PilO